VRVNARPATASRPRHRSGLLGQLTRFILVGGVSALVDYGVYQGLLQLDVYVHLAKSISFICGTTTAYLLNRRFTFAASATAGRAQFVKFLVLYGLTFCVNVGINALALRLLPDGLPGETSIAWLLAQGTATSINFVVLRVYVFRR